MHRLLRSLSGERVLYFKVPGNAGDSLIHSGTLAAYERAGVKFDYVELGDDVRGRLVLIGGGGNLVPFYQNVATAFADFSAHARAVVVLPHTIRGHDATIRSFRDVDTIICRDVPSLEHVRGLVSGPRVRLGHDMAFHLDVDKFLLDPDLAAMAEPVLHRTLATRGATMRDLTGQAFVSVMRHDGERHPSAPPSELDLSELFLLGYGPVEAKVATWCFLTCIASAPHVVTDRLHVAIGAAMLGTSCDLYDNSYGKNRAVYDYSLSKFPGISFQPFPEAPEV